MTSSSRFIGNALRNLCSSISNGSNGGPPPAKEADYFRSLIENSSDIILVVNLQGTIEYQSPSTKRILGYTSGELVGHQLFDFVHPEDRARSFQAFKQKFITPKITRPLVNRCRHKDGSWRLFETISKFHAGRWGVPQLIVNARDITDRQHAENENRRAQAFLQSLIDNLPHMIFVKDAQELRFTLFNKAGEDLLGISSNDILGKNDYDFFPREQADYFTTIDRQVLNGGQLTDIPEEPILSKRLGERLLHTKKIPLRDSEGQLAYLLGISEDITERKKLEMQLLQSGKLSAVGQLASGVAHEINNPLGVILGLAQALLRRVSADDILHHPLKSIEREALRCKSLVQNLLLFSRTASVERDLLQLNSAIEGALALVRAQARIGDIQVQQDLCPDLPSILGNPNQIQQIVVNLANNALDAMGKQGTMTIRTYVSRLKNRNWVSLSVSDTGPGIPPPILPRIFEPFFTTKPVGKGTGLGLGLVHEIVEKHEGMIDVKSRPGCTEFCVRIPVPDSSVLPVKQAA